MLDADYQLEYSENKNKLRFFFERPFKVRKDDIKKDDINLITNFACLIGEIFKILYYFKKVSLL